MIEVYKIIVTLLVHFWSQNIKFIIDRLVGKATNMRDQGQDLRHRGQVQGQNLQGQGLIDIRSQCQKHTFEAYIFASYVYLPNVGPHAEHCTCRLNLSCRRSWPRPRRQMLCPASKYRKYFSARESRPGPRRLIRPGSPKPKGQGLDLRGQGQGRGLDFRGHGQWHASLASRPRPWPRGLYLCFL